MQPSAYEELKPDADDLLVFVDDTGHETFAGNQGFYGLGACVVVGWMYWSVGNICNAQTPLSNLSPDLQEVVKLSQSHMGDDVIVNYIKSSGKSYRLSADDIIYLNGQGVSQSVISTLQTASSASPNPPPAASSPATPAPPVAAPPAAPAAYAPAPAAAGPVPPGPAATMMAPLGAAPPSAEPQVLLLAVRAVVHYRAQMERC